MGIFSWLWPFGKKKEEVIEKPEYMDEYVSRYRRLEEIKSTGPHVPSVKQLYAAETATERALRLDKERREARIDELSRIHQLMNSLELVKVLDILMLDIHHLL